MVDKVKPIRRVEGKVISEFFFFIFGPIHSMQFCIAFAKCEVKNSKLQVVFKPNRILSKLTNLQRRRRSASEVVEFLLNARKKL